HGGVICSIIDAAAFWAVYGQAPEDVGMTSVDLKLNYLAPASGSKLLAEGKMIKLGRTLGYGQAEVMDENGRILASGSSTLMVIPDLSFRYAGQLPPKFL
ncbi:MAG: PaaI family thioesterase, partial [Pseudomonadota bacterium]